MMGHSFSCLYTYIIPIGELWKHIKSKKKIYTTALQIYERRLPTNLWKGDCGVTLFPSKQNNN